MARARPTALALAALFVGAALVAPTFADETTGRTPVPAIPKGKGDHCVRDTDFMRRYHMTMLKHQRDETVHDGVRNGDFSIKACVACHAVNGADGQPVSYADPRHFCRSCHSYASVSIDCFECHASKPAVEEKAPQAGTFADDRDLAAINDYLREARP
jgi:predicted CXXCH cytochrome family protein